jgi:hypothetical protein
MNLLAILNKAVELVPQVKAHLTERTLDILARKYSPDQPRDDIGRWTDEGIGYTPNIIGNSENMGEFPPTEEQLLRIKQRINEMPEAIRKLEPIDSKHRQVRKLNGEIITPDDNLYIGIMPNDNKYPKPMGSAYSKANGLYINEEFIGTPIQDHEYIHTLLFRNKSINNGLYDGKYNPPWYFDHAEYAQNQKGEQITMLLTGYSDNNEKWIDNIIHSDVGKQRTRDEAKSQITELSRFFKEVGVW